jgi:hypothetical protein
MDSAVTRLVLTLRGPGDDIGSATVDVLNTFEECADKILPQYGSSGWLEERARCTWQKIDGSRMLLHPSYVAWVDEVYEEDDD